MRTQDILDAAVESHEAFVIILRTYLSEEGLSTKEFSEAANVPESTLYKILSKDEVDFRVSTLRQICQYIQEREEDKKDFIALITSRSVLDAVTTRKIALDGREISVRDYPAVSIEEVIIQAVRAQKDGALGLVCGPIAATTAQKCVDIPVAEIRLDGSGTERALEAIKSRL